MTRFRDQNIAVKYLRIFWFGLIDTTYVGGSSFEFRRTMPHHIAAGKCNVLLTHGSTAHLTAGRLVRLATAATFINMKTQWGCPMAIMR